MNHYIIQVSLTHNLNHFDIFDDINLNEHSFSFAEQEEEGHHQQVSKQQARGELLSDRIRLSLANKIQELSQRKIMDFDMTESVVHETKLEAQPNWLNNDHEISLKGSGVSRTRKKRALITMALLEKMKPLFEQYRQQKNNPNIPYQNKLSMKQIIAHFDISGSQVRALYEQFCKDPLFMSRRTRAENLERVKNSGKRPPNAVNSRRIEFIRQLLKDNPGISSNEVRERINQVERLHRIDAQGNRIPISITTINRLLLQSRQNMSQRQTSSINSPISIKHRFDYARRYQEVANDKNADVCFIGEFSFVNCFSLSSCPPEKRASFVRKDRRGGVNGRSMVNGGGSSAEGSGVKLEDGLQSRDVQYLVAMTVSGIIYFQIYHNIFEEMNFEKVVNTIGRALCARNTNQKKYLILQSNQLHTKEPLRQLQRVFDIKVLFIPPMSPMLNPTQYLFTDVKTIVRSRSNKQKHKSYHSLLTEVLQSNELKNQQHNFECMKPYLGLALNQAPYK